MQEGISRETSVICEKVGATDIDFHFSAVRIDAFSIANDILTLLPFESMLLHL
jgi:hypothetical protein